MTKSVKNWRARRAGGRITVYGEDAKTSEPVRITRIDVIRPGTAPGNNCCIAIGHDKVEHHLLLS